MSTRLTSVIHGLACTIVLLCVAVPALPASVPAHSDATRGLDLAKMSKEEVASAEAFAQSFLEQMTTERQELALEAFDLEGILETTFDGIGSEAESAQMRDGARGPMRQSFLHVLTVLGKQESKLKRLVMVNGQLRARYRFNGDNGITFLDLEMARRGDGWTFRDLHNLSYGLSSLDEMRSMAILLHAKSSTGLLARMFGTDAISSEDINNLKQLGLAFQGGKFELALALYEKMPKVMQDSSAMTAIHLQLLQNGTDENKYIAALEAATARFPAPKFRMLMVDAHLLRERWKDAIKCLDEAMIGIERDAVVLTLRASILLMSGAVDEARKSTIEALALEPDCRSVLVGSLDVYLTVKDWSAVAACIRKLEATGEFEFRGNLVGEIWQEFLTQPESKPWR